MITELGNNGSRIGKQTSHVILTVPRFWWLGEWKLNSRVEGLE